MGSKGVRIKFCSECDLGNFPVLGPYLRRVPPADTFKREKRKMEKQRKKQSLERDEKLMEGKINGNRETQGKASIYQRFLISGVL